MSGVYIIMCACGSTMRVQPNDNRRRCDQCLRDDKDEDRKKKKKVKREPSRN